MERFIPFTGRIHTLLYIGDRIGAFLGLPSDGILRNALC